MIELWSKEQINENLSDQDAKDMLQYLQDMKSADEMPDEYGDWKVLDFTRVFEEYLQAVVQHKTKNLTLIVHDGLDGFRKEQAFHRERIVRTSEWVGFEEYNKNPGPIRA